MMDLHHQTAEAISDKSDTFFPGRESEFQTIQTIQTLYFRVQSLKSSSAA